MPYGLKSTQEQLADIRDASELPVSCVHIDTCLSDYLQDHHNRDGECLFGVYVDGRMTIGEVLDGLRSEYQMSGDRIESDIATDEACKAAITAAFADADPAKLFDASLESPPREEDYESDDLFSDAQDEWELNASEGPQAWFLLTWDEPEETAA